MAKYVAATSDIPRSYVKRMWLIGLVGTLGFHYFAVKKLKTGFWRLLFGAVMWMGTIALIVMLVTEPEARNQEGAFAFPFFCFAINMIPALYDLFKLWLGRFTDNVGAFLRE